MSTYQFMDHAEWIEDHYRAIRKPLMLTDFQKRVMDILGMVGGGIYNAPINPSKINWNHGGGVSVVWQGNDLSTFDFDQLTKLVFLCHAARIRCEVKGCGPRQLRLSFWQRKPEGDMAVRHPNLAEALESFEEYLPADHRVRFDNQTEKAA